MGLGYLKRLRGGIVAAYVIYQGEVLDAKRYDEYKTKAAASILAAGGEYLVRGGDVEVLEGEAPAGRLCSSFRDEGGAGPVSKRRLHRDPQDPRG
jgi:hypothetical protein